MEKVEALSIASAAKQLTTIVNYVNGTNRVDFVEGGKIWASVKVVNRGACREVWPLWPNGTTQGVADQRQGTSGVRWRSEDDQTTVWHAACLVLNRARRMFAGTVTP